MIINLQPEQTEPPAVKEEAEKSSRSLARTVHDTVGDPLWTRVE